MSRMSCATSRSASVFYKVVQIPQLSCSRTPDQDSAGKLRSEWNILVGFEIYLPEHSSAAVQSEKRRVKTIMLSK